MDRSSKRSSAPLTFQDHSRRFESNRYVYAVLSRRSKGISVGVNLNPDKVCNFDCIYCQVDRTTPPEVRRVDESRLFRELGELLRVLRDEGPQSFPRFAAVPREMRRVVDVAFSGDGEPTSYPRFYEVVEETSRLLNELAMPEVRLTLITNGSLLHRPRVRDALTLMDRHGGEIWAKLDAGTADLYHRVCVTWVPFEKVLRNIREAGRSRPLVIQSLFIRIDGSGPDREEVAAYATRLRELLDAGCLLDRVQVYTVARPPAEDSVSALSEAELSAIAATVRTRCPELQVETFGPTGAGEALPAGESVGRSGRRGASGVSEGKEPGESRHTLGALG
jgi:wyosine [tRNA(Phe)-imidazoG37] synthetase (radical SAM superfamily)